MLIIPMMAGDRGKDAKWTFFWAFLFGALGGAFALLLLKPTEESAAVLEDRERELDTKYLARKQPKKNRISEDQYLAIMKRKR